MAEILPTPTRIDRTSRRIAWALGIVAALCVLVTLADPGITIDEPLDVRPGRTYVETFASQGLGFFRRDVVDRVFGDNKEHPPLGRWLLGLASKLGEPIEILLMGGPDPVGIYVLSGRIAPALVFGLLVGLTTWESGRRHGPIAAIASGFALIAMPRVFSHAHLGALDLFIAAGWSIALVAANRALDGPRTHRGMAIAGLFWGIALLLKIHAWLLVPIVIVRALITLPIRRAFSALVIWSAVGLIVFFLGWPWLWFDSVARLLSYLGTGVDRVPIFVQYFGTVYRDRDVPWHFPWFYFATTVPIGLHFLGIVGLIDAVRRRDRSDLTIAAAIAFILAVFSTNVPVYDGERLYLLTFPLWALLIGRGFAVVIYRFRGRWARLIFAGLLLAQGWGVVAFHPFGLSYYNLLVGGLRGADRLGLEVAYWSESVDRTILDELARRAAPGESAALSPTLAPGQGIMATSRALARRKLVLGDQEAIDRVDWLIVYSRQAYWSEATRQAVDQGEIIFDRMRQGVPIARLVRIRKAITPPGQ